MEIIADLLPAERIQEALARIEQLEVEDVPGGVVILPGTKELLGSLPDGGWAVVTSVTRRLAEARLHEVGIDPPLLVAADDITRGKPDPEPFLVAARSSPPIPPAARSSRTLPRDWRPSLRRRRCPRPFTTVRNRPRNRPRSGQMRPICGRV
jgi:hypothetical protein